MSKIVFRTQLSNDSDKFISECGCALTDDYSYVIDEDTGVQSLQITGHTNLQEQIQADADSCDINKLMLRFSLGDESALNQVQGAYLDATNMPKTLAELFERNNKCEKFFDSLPVDLRALFDNSYTEYWTQFGTDEFDMKYEEYNSRFDVSPEFNIDKKEVLDNAE